MKYFSFISDLTDEYVEVYQTGEVYMNYKLVKEKSKYEDLEKHLTKESMKKKLKEFYERTCKITS